MFIEKYNNIDFNIKSSTQKYITKNDLNEKIINNIDENDIINNKLYDWGTIDD